MSAIEWTEKTWNPIVGCSIISPGCTNCYAMKMAYRLEAMAGDGLDDNGYAIRGTHPLGHYRRTTRLAKAGKPVWTGKLAKAPQRTLLEPLRRRKPTMWFVNSMSDLFHEAVPDAWLDEILSVMGGTEQHTFQVLTKRSERMRDYLRTHRAQKAWNERRLDREAWPARNVWWGVSVEDQDRVVRLYDLLNTPASIRFVSFEPMLDRITVPWAVRSQLDWAIIGGESGPGARPFPVSAARDLIGELRTAAVAVFVKQFGAAPVYGTIPTKLVHPKGGDPTEWPIDMQFREMPKTPLEIAQ